MAGPVQLAGDVDDLCLGSADARREACLVAGRDVSTRESNLGYIRRTIKAALGSTQARKVRGPLLDMLYARLMRCGNLACGSGSTGRIVSCPSTSFPPWSSELGPGLMTHRLSRGCRPSATGDVTHSSRTRGSGAAVVDRAIRANSAIWAIGGTNP